MVTPTSTGGPGKHNSLHARHRPEEFLFLKHWKHDPGGDSTRRQRPPQPRTLQRTVIRARASTNHAEQFTFALA